MTSSCTSMQAPKACAQLELGGYTDWYLPARGQMQHLIDYQDEIHINEMNFHWTSTEIGRNDVASQDFVTPSQRENHKSMHLVTRCVRSF